jgi:hypothetical protein
MSTSRDFSGTEFAAGDVRGLRLWNPVASSDDPDPGNPTTVLLKSVYREYYWSPGVNVARCTPLGRDSKAGPPLIRREECKEQHKHGGDWPFVSGDLRCHREHLIGIDPECECGFYAYTATTDNPYLRSDRSLHVQGIIQGWGRTIIGTKGFRCTMARIAALVLPLYIHDELSSAQRDKAERVEDALRRQYTTIPIYPTLDAMLEDNALYPKTQPSPR